MSALQDLIMNPRYHDLLSIVKGARNGFVYGVKIRFPHALVMTFLFSKQPLPAKIKAIIRATFTHAKNLAKFVSIYKVVLLLQRYLGGRKSNPGAGAAAAAAGPATRERSLDTFVAGLIGGWIVFGERNAINEQIVLYVSSRVMAAFLPRLIASAPGPISNGNAHAAAAASTSAMSAASSSSGGSWLGSLLSNTPLEPLSQPLPELTSRAANPRPIPPADLPFSIFAAVMWGAVMYLYRHRGERLQPGMVNSMVYLYRDSEKWSNLKTLLWHNK